ncbi:MAG: hypothetical protein MJZ68_07845 [archaeon]|nr:hypothetical protein [archaeon]
MTVAPSASDPEVRSVKRNISETVRRCRSSSQEVLIGNLDPVLDHWVERYGRYMGRRCLKSVDFHLHRTLYRWARRRHSHKSNEWIVGRYWRPFNGSTVFGTPDAVLLTVTARAVRLRTFDDTVTERAV